jgi:putative phosphoribosyl transferase
VSHDRALARSDRSRTAAIETLRRLGPARLVVAAGVGAPQACAAVTGMADDCVCALRPPTLDAVSRWYVDFSQTTEAQVRDLLQRARAGPHDLARAL